MLFLKKRARNVDFRTCEEKLGKRDGLFKLIRPSRPEWMTAEDYAQVPEELIVRMVGTKNVSLLPPSRIKTFIQSKRLLIYTYHDGMSSWISGQSRP